MKFKLGVVLGVVAALTAIPASADGAQTYFDTFNSPGSAKDLEVGVDVRPGLWVGTPLLGVSSFGASQCSVIKMKSYPPSSEGNELEDFLVSRYDKPMTYRLANYGTVSFGGECTWTWLRG